jgi:uncharacterized Zn finger protein
MRHRRRPRPKGPFPPRSVPLAATGGIKAESRAGEFGKSWWAKRWQSVLESFKIASRLARGRTYARTGQVLSIDITTGEVKARVQGSRTTPYDVSIRLPVLSEEEWDRVLEVLSRQAIFVAKLLAGQMPQDIERIFTQANQSLFPQKRGDLETDCSCPDPSNPCKHIAAVYYLLGEEFDRDPFLLFRLRGLDRDRLLARLGTSVAGKQPASAREAPAAAEPLPKDPAEYWSAPPPGEDLFGEVQPPPVSMGLVLRLGKFPLWRGEKPLAESLEPAYIQAAQEGLNTFLGEAKE